MKTPSLQFGLITQESSFGRSNHDVVYAQRLRGDGALACTEMGLFMVCSGMGVREEAGRAARIIVQIVAAGYSQHILLPCLETGTAPTEVQVTQHMVDAFHKANQTVFNESSPVGGSLTAAVMLDNQIHLLHVGNTRAYLVREEEITQLTKDHDFVQALVDAGEFASREDLWEEVINKGGHVTNALYCAFGQTESLKRIDSSIQTFEDGTGILLCSGSLKVEYPQDMEKTLRIIHGSHKSQDACQRLIDWVKKQGFYGDTSAIFISRSFPFKPE